MNNSELRQDAFQQLQVQLEPGSQVQEKEEEEEEENIVNGRLEIIILEKEPSTQGKKPGSEPAPHLEVEEQGGLDQPNKMQQHVENTEHYELLALRQNEDCFA